MSSLHPFVLAEEYEETIRQLALELHKLKRRSIIMERLVFIQGVDLMGYNKVAMEVDALTGQLARMEVDNDDMWQEYIDRYICQGEIPNDLDIQ